MSRSYRKPYFTDGQDSPGLRKLLKRQANRRVRASKEVASGTSYKKVSDSWDIRDWSFHSPTVPKARRK